MNRPDDRHDDRITLVGGGPLTLSVAHGLVAAGHRSLRLLGDTPVSPTLAQQSRFLSASDSGRLLGDVLRRQLEVAFEAQPLPRTREEWVDGLAGARAVVALVEGPILFWPWLDTVNEILWSQKVPWLSAAPLDGKELHVGPLVVPGATACYKCYELRYKSNLGLLEAYLPFERFVQQAGETRDFGFLPPLADLIAGIAVEEIDAVVAGRPSLLEGRLVTIDPALFRIERHPVLRLPRCPVCTPANTVAA